MSTPSISDLVTEGRLKEALEALKEAAELRAEPRMVNDLILQMSRYNSNERNYNRGVITSADYRRTQNRIILAILEYSKELKDVNASLADSRGTDSESGVEVSSSHTSGMKRTPNPPIQLDYRDVHSTPEERAGSEFEADKNPGIRPNDKGDSNGQMGGESDSGAKDSGGSAIGKDDSVKKILYLAASPKGETRIEGDKEFSRITAAMERGRKRDNYVFLHPQFAVTGEELIRSMRDEPHIIHFSVHGEPEALIISDHDNNAQNLPQVALTRLLRPLSGITEVVILNSCYSTHIAKEISKLGMYVTGNNFEILDTASISFVSGLYSGLGEGKTFEEAYNDAMVMVGIMNPEEIHILEVWKDGEKLDI